MFLHVCQFRPSEGLPLGQIKGKLCNEGQVSIREEMDAAFSNRIGSLGIDIPSPVDIPHNSEILARADGQGICRWQQARLKEGVGKCELISCFHGFNLLLSSQRRHIAGVKKQD